MSPVQSPTLSALFLIDIKSTVLLCIKCNSRGASDSGGLKFPDKIPTRVLLPPIGAVRGAERSQHSSDKSSSKSNAARTRESLI